MALIDIANVIAQIEGWLVPNSLAQRNNNPGNLRFVGQNGAIEGEKGFAKFSTPEAGMEALQNQISLDASRGLDVTGFLNKYAPATENNTSNYISLFTSKLGVGANDLLSSIIGDNMFGSGGDINGDSSSEDGQGGIGLVLGVTVLLGLGYVFFGRS